MMYLKVKEVLEEGSEEKGASGSEELGSLSNTSFTSQTLQSSTTITPIYLPIHWKEI